MLTCVWYYPVISSMGSVCQCLPVSNTTQTSALVGQHLNACLCLILPRYQLDGVSMPLLACVWYNPDISWMVSVSQCLSVSNTTQTSALVGQHVNACMCLIQPRHHLYGVSIPMLACVWYYPDSSSMWSVYQCLPVSDTTQTSSLWCQYTNACMCLIQPRHQFYGVSKPMLACVQYYPDISSSRSVCQCLHVSDSTQTLVPWGQYINAYLCLILPRYQLYGVSIPMIACVWYYPDISSMVSVCHTYLCLILPRHQLDVVSMPMLACVWYDPYISSIGSVCQCMPVLIRSGLPLYSVSMPMLACVWYYTDIIFRGFGDSALW